MECLTINYRGLQVVSIINDDIPTSREIREFRGWYGSLLITNDLNKARSRVNNWYVGWLPIMREPILSIDVFFLEIAAYPIFWENPSGRLLLYSWIMSY